ncbi:MAG: hypothetical protein KBH82_02245 [Syntrophorhabdaceae bacterium]|jgi:hypothetical protein|nr:hypothetical protein [Syntrophorhabdaceae bacterium]
MIVNTSLKKRIQGFEDSRIWKSEGFEDSRIQVEKGRGLEGWRVGRLATHLPIQTSKLLQNGIICFQS